MLRTIEGSKILGPIEKPQEMADLLFCQHTENNITNFRISGTLAIFIPSAIKIF
jgi:hypothetical protein